MAVLPFAQRIRQPKPLLVDGAMGTMLHEQGLPIGACFDALCLHEPERVARVHRAFLDAGSELLETNTFSANRFKLANHGLEDQLTAINRAAVRVAREAMREGEGESLYLAGSIGPLGVRLQPYGRVAREDARAAFRQQAEALLAEGVDLIVLETFSDLNELLEGLAALRELDPSMPVACQMTFENDDRTQLGWLPGAVARGLMDAGADIIGINCSSGPAQIARLLQAMQHSAPGQRYSAQPNAGFPEAVGNRVMYPATVDYFADYALTFRDLGAVLIGGCCGTQPDHVAAMRRALDDPQASSPPLPALVHIEDEEDLAPDRPTRLADQLTRREFVISVEMAPPRSYTPQRLLNAARTLQEAGADVINVADSPAARMRMSPWAIGHLLQSRLGMETVLHFPTRSMDEHKVFLEEKHKTLYKCEHHRELFGCLNFYWNYLAYDLLDELIQALSQKDLSFVAVTRKMEVYKEDLQQFRIRTPLKLFCQAQRKTEDDPPPGFREMVVRHNWPDTVTLEDVERFRQKYMCAFNLRKCAMMCNGIVPGSFTVTWFIPLSVIPILKKKRSLEVIRMFDISRLEIDRHCVYQTPVHRNVSCRH